MSRLIVKNLPVYLTQQRLRSHFEASDGPGSMLTDVKLVLNADGTSRRFGFIGYKTPAEAERAKKWFNRTFIDSSRITVDIVDGVKDAPPSRPNKRPRLGPSPAEAQITSEISADAKGSKKKTKVSKEQSDAKKNEFNEFMQVMQPRVKKGPSWANDAVAPVPGPSTLKSANDAKVDSDSSRATKNKQSKKLAEVEDNEKAPSPEEAATSEAISDMDWFKRHTKSALDDPELEPQRVFEQSDDEDDLAASSEHDEDKSPPSDPVKDTILQTSRLFLRNLAFTCTEDELRELFQSHGEISQVHIPLDPTSKQPKGLAYVTFAKPADALAAFEALDKSSFQGRLLHILPAVDRKGKVDDDSSGRRKTLKDEREVKRKAGAGREFNWAMLYMNSDAVASSIADRMNIAKSEILNSESDNAAVKLALAETHIINETKAFLEQHGVVLSSLTLTKQKRSDTVILVKNIPYGTSADTLRTMFGSHGELRRVLVPPAGTLAVVEYEHAVDARTAFRALAYRRLGTSIMYLERAPLGMFAGPPVDAAETTREPVVATAVAPVKVPISADALVETDGATEAEPPLSAGTTLFIKNLAFSTTTAGLVHALRHLPGFAFARVQAKVDPARPGVRLSMGYGFVGFRTKDEAKRGMKSLEGFVLDGHVLTVKWAGRGVDEVEEEAKGKPKSAKMVVKNVPFEATKKDIQELFGAHAQLKSVRLPRKFDRRTRGFAFLEFISPHEAARAYATLRHTHLLGRHLVLEWAEDGAADVDELRKKAGVGFGGGKEMPGRKRKLDLGNGDVEDDL
ncbi:RNA-binding domain-containing protein [Laetiporus sulphureus 93-53]|uniref:Multiple RNA-binding domain-containing protein 1 n=1 Tax=Laetiporus sulphureus 93-53 TaxID=1314785 RepID=A0A165B4T6_9APHY|nr:RNA-binding domain-containing protein [Laetiporus sulphureus 93-53]KZT00240.1 RNA-binding domain-containing protein [Laetiporus sulphureus 93-53]